MKWYEFKAQNERKNVLFSTVSIYRNLEKYPFMSRLSSGSSASCAKINQISEKIYEALIPHGYDKISIDAHKISLDNDSIAANCLGVTCEATDKLPNLLFHSGEDKNVFVAPCSREHVTISATYPSLSVLAALEDALDAEEKIETECPFAFNDSLGYLMKDADLCGCGLTLEAMLFLPMCDKYSKIDDVKLIASALDASVRSAFDSSGLYILSKEARCSTSERESALFFEGLVNKICALEEGLASYLLGRERDTALLREQCACAEYIAANSSLITPSDLPEIYRSLRIKRTLLDKEANEDSLCALNSAFYLLEACAAAKDNAPLELCRSLAQKLKEALFPIEIAIGE